LGHEAAVIWLAGQKVAHNLVGDCAVRRYAVVNGSHRRPFDLFIGVV